MAKVIHIFDYKTKNMLDELGKDPTVGKERLSDSEIAVNRKAHNERVIISHRLRSRKTATPEGKN